MKRFAFALISTVALALGTQGVLAQNQPFFRPDDPIRTDPDRLPSPVPSARKIPMLYDFVLNTFLTRAESDELIPPAMNCNTLGEVPDSSWFTNRIGIREMSIEELTTGPNVSGGPDFEGPWTIVGAKAQGITPGFTIEDSKGVTYFVKFDPPGYPQLATSAEAVVTRFFYAFGYHVPENYLGRMRPENLSISAEARLTDQEGKERRFTYNDLERIMGRIYRDSGGSTPVIASRRLPGRPVGPFTYFGTRSDDPNDIFPHQHRRELRGMRLFAAWLNHDDSRSINSLDTYQGEPGEGALLHYLIDFGSCLGSGSVKPQTRRAGHEYILEWGPILKAALTLGIWDRKWRYLEYPDLPSVGRIEGDFFTPQEWKPEYPNPAFERMLPEDAYWAARIIRKFTDEAVRALVETGHYPDAAQEYLVQTLIKRRDKILRRYLPAVIPIDEFRIDRAADGGARLHFKDLAVESGILPPSQFRYTWHRFDNWTSRRTPLAITGEVSDGVVPVPSDPGEYLVVQIDRLASEQVGRIYVRRTTDSWEIVGVERE